MVGVRAVWEVLSGLLCVAGNVIWLLDRAIHEYTKPREILTDHGSQFWSVPRGESSFDCVKA
jgi:hypothetical protein